ncbi:TetR/AcrR family transcriptional regulator [Pacificimonas sp. WHA3]|uniref:TetR/AcrR family transcriptional regulator n=1 Tax=Pacificimonas pallii TaxID=2827236 RepID=A0ABS6SBH1_9SPHN|nr:TetR/AcrR family transcriptional regulator [Pacificimonas pallii]MBV7255281.1 TetR/AcrR family transcriptional regulator [Pacificimonas pallii]
MAKQVKTKPVGRPRHSAEDQKIFVGRIVRIARELFFESGFEAVSMRNIAQRANCSPMTIYYYFENKHAILQQIWITIFDEIYRLLALERQAHAGALETFKAVAARYVRYWQDNPEHFHLIYLTVDPKSITMGDAVLNAQGSSVRKCYDLIESVLTECVDDGHLAGAEPQEMAQLLYSSIYGMLLCTLTIPEYEWMAQDEFAREIIHRFLRSYAP